MSTLNFHHAKMSVSQYNLKLFTLVLIYASRSHFFLVAQLQVLYHCLAPSSMSVNVEREEVFTIQGHEDSLEAVSMGFVVLCSLLSLIKLSLFFFFFQASDSSHLFCLHRRKKTLLWKPRWRGMQTAQFNEWSTLGTRARVAALVQSRWGHFQG